MSVTELRTGLAIRLEDESLKEKRLLPNPQETILSLCSPFVEVVESAKMVRTIHFTVDKYLLRYLERNRIAQSQHLSQCRHQDRRKYWVFSAAKLCRYCNSNLFAITGHITSALRVHKLF